MDKKGAAQVLLSTYTDYYGRTTLYKDIRSDAQNGLFDSENQHLWTGEGLILLCLLDLVEDVNLENFRNSLRNTKTGHGLYARHPKPYIDSEHHNVSWDEYAGIMMSLAVAKNKRTAQSIIDYGEANRWVFLDSDDDLLWVPEKYTKRKWTKWLYLRLSAWRQPKERMFYKVVAGEKPSAFQVFHMALALLHTAKRPPGDTSGKLLAWFKIKALKILGYESKILDYAIKKFDKRMKNMYGNESYIENLVEIYFKDKDHPFHTLVKGMKL